MSLSKSVDIEKFIKKMKDFSGAEIKAMCTEAGYFAIRANRKHILLKDFIGAIAKVKRREAVDGEDYLHMFG